MIKKVSERIKKEPMMFDVLGDIMQTLRFRGSIFFNSKLATPWGMSFNTLSQPRFHIALSGDFFIGTDIENRSSINVKHMDIVMLPHGNMHWIADQTNRKLTPSADAGSACELGFPLFQHGRITHRLMCGIAYYDDEILHPILDSLPEVLHFSDLHEQEPIWTTVKSIDSAMRGTYISQTSIVDRLCEVLFLQLLNKYSMEVGPVTGFFSALQDKRIYRVLELFHRNPKKQWSLESLGEKTGMSRATLVRQFNKTVGVTPMKYLANWRMAKAYYQVKYSSKTSEHIAESIGFSTARTLSKAFQLYYGFTPKELRTRISKMT